MTADITQKIKDPISKYAAEHDTDSIINTHIIGAGKPLPLGFYITLDPEFWDTTTADTL